ncbi:MAG: 50S ribosomal protein L25 [Pleurocapsa minor GSE-CHR-MK-17-07R]|nr:50S ribosomal protein L25 [Pleurocapsa minor GSE-CHR-MK 17-07R]
MSDSYTLEAQARTVIGKKVSQLRRSGLVPVVVYGSKSDPVNLQIPYRALQVTLLKAGGTHLININVEGSKPQSVLARSVQRHPIKGEILHVDFLAVDASTKIATVVPLHFVGEAPAEKARLGVLLNGLQTLDVEALPADLIDSVDVDLSVLKAVGDSIHVRDLKISDKVTVLTGADEMVVRIIVQEEQTETSDAPVSAEPEVLKKGKTDEEDAE